MQTRKLFLSCMRLCRQPVYGLAKVVVQRLIEHLCFVQAESPERDSAKKNVTAIYSSESRCGDSDGKKTLLKFCS
jgi:hypothetical protein